MIASLLCVARRSPAAVVLDGASEYLDADRPGVPQLDIGRESAVALLIALTPARRTGSANVAPMFGLM